MKDFFIGILTLLGVILTTAIPISIIGYIFSDDSFTDVLKTSVMLATGLTALALVLVMLIFAATTNR